ncbi:Phosphatidylinositol 4-kinase [Erysiphe necator]|nr:Phosphatidylinositol 4-kinase [Erysiphe necator]
MSWNLLKRFIESEVFNQSPYLCVAYLSRYANHVGIHYVLCSKLRKFRYEEIEFFLPQLCHLIVSANESMALEEFILDLCEDYVNAALLTFWLFKTYLHDHSSNPQSKAFKTSSRVLNKVHKIIFGVSEQAHNENENINENVLPVTVLASFVLASVGAPILLKWAGPLAIGQARKPQQTEDFITDARQSQQRVCRSKTVSGAASRSRIRNRGLGEYSMSQEDLSPVTRTSSLDSTPSLSNSSRNQQLEPRRRPPNIDLRNCASLPSYSSLSAVHPGSNSMLTNSTQPMTASLSRSNSYRNRMLCRGTWPLTPPPLSEAQKVKLLRQNYFRCENLFLTALEDISNKLVVVPKAARLSVLRAELALIAQDLPAEVDIPVICPPTLVDGAPGKSRHHRIVRLNPAEAMVLNSAEKVPFLLMVEVLRDNFSFDPNTSDNHALLEKLITERGTGRRRIFDLSESTRGLSNIKALDEMPQLVLQQSTENLKNSDSLTPTKETFVSTENLLSGEKIIPEILTPRTPGIFSSRPSSPIGRPIVSNLQIERIPASEQTYFSALATHMRTASQMLNQLENTSGKRPKHEVAAIRAKIIASMQSLEEQNFSEMRETQKLDQLDEMKVNAEQITKVIEDEEKGEENTKFTLGIEAGAARMENDQKTGGIQRKADQDDPSAATFGEAWIIKKERIRKSSPYGWMKNWDVLSVIVKTGADLRQEAFACQLIQVCHDIWKDAKVPVWVERMRILVTGESSGLIETITNGISLHSIKRSLTLAAIESGQNPRRRIASLKDHFLKAFGLPESEAYLAAVDAFKRSLAAYSIISYVLQLKDRHNGNVLIDNEGHIIHIDFGFMLSNSPGSVGFEAAPFKLTQDYVDVLGGVASAHFDEYKQLCKQAFQALRHSADNLIDLVNIMGCESNMPCFAQGVQQVALSLRQRFQLQMSAEEAQQFVETDLIMKSLGSYYTRLYDTFQYRTQGIY